MTQQPVSLPDRIFMEQALALARRGKGDVLPNPMVGAVIVRDGKVLGKGYHRRYGGIHAEAEALRDCSENPEGATLYVTLEPCCHRSTTKHNPPCVEVLAKAGIKRVVIARSDLNSAVFGKGICFMKKQGIDVSCGVLEEQSAALNRVYETLVCHNRPFVHLKAAISADGFLAAADGTSRWISCSISRQKVMEFRGESDAVLTGKGTLFTDYPSFTVRNTENVLDKDKQPVRVFLSTTGKIPEGWLEKMVHRQAGGAVLIYHNSPVPLRSNDLVEFKQVHAAPGGLCLSSVLKDLRDRNINQLLVEGGSRVFSSFLRNRFWDKLTLFVAPILLGSGIPFSEGLGISTITEKLHLKNPVIEVSGEDVMLIGYREEVSCLPV